ncbi:uncharacterized protein [Primulina eburnea]|uniref:uncharacterized protein isoform X2 n=1 Tax=Primulina eburnea TaxID=1245227 RepID=UPI003C6BF747
MPKDAEKYLLSCGLVNALYSIRTSDLTEELFDILVPCPIQSNSVGETTNNSLTKKRSQKALWLTYGEAVGPMLTSNDSSRKHLKLDPNGVDQNSSACLSCTLEFDGSSKGNPGQAGAGAIIRSDDGSLLIILHEGLGVATSNAAEYRGFILGLKYALGKGFTEFELGGLQTCLHAGAFLGYTTRQRS